MPNTYIIGHQKPDTDSVIAAMAVEHLYSSLEYTGYQNLQAVLADPVNNETQFLLDKFGTKAPKVISPSDINPNDQFILVDHNEASQRLNNINESQLIEIIDHHKLNLNLNKPIFATIKAWGSTCTIIYFLMKHLGDRPVIPSKSLSGLMLAAILSDTVGLKSPTTTDTDREFAEELAELSQINNIDQFTLKIFKAKSNVSQLTPTQIVKNDYKLFEFDRKTFIGQLETVEQEKVLTSQKEQLLTAMKNVKEEENVELLFLAITDILKVNTKLLILGEAEQKIAQQAFNGKVKKQIMDIGPKLSRKKEIAPAIEQAQLSI